jgi:hypothetical protein
MDDMVKRASGHLTVWPWVIGVMAMLVAAGAVILTYLTKVVQAFAPLSYLYAALIGALLSILLAWSAMAFFRWLKGPGEEAEASEHTYFDMLGPPPISTPQLAEDLRAEIARLGDRLDKRVDKAVTSSEIVEFQEKILWKAAWAEQKSKETGERLGQLSGPRSGSVRSAADIACICRSVDCSWPDGGRQS